MSEFLIPNDLPGCQSLIVEMATTMTAQGQAIADKDQAILALKQKSVEQQLKIAELLRRMFQKHSERYLADPGQLQLDFGEGIADAAEGLADAVEEAKKITVPEHTRFKNAPKKTRNEQLPAHLERRDVELAVPEAMRVCPTHGERTVIGYDYLETLMFEQPKLWVQRLAIPKFGCAGFSACGVAAPDRPEGERTPATGGWSGDFSPFGDRSHGEARYRNQLKFGRRVRCAGRRSEMMFA